MKASQYLEVVSKRLQQFINPLTLQTLKSFFDGFNLGYVLARENLQFHDIPDAWISVVEIRGWKVNAFGLEAEMKERGMTEREMIDEYVQIEIEVWKLLEKQG
jgi:hypothetical protein